MSRRMVLRRWLKRQTKVQSQSWEVLPCRMAVAHRDTMPAGVFLRRWNKRCGRQNTGGHCNHGYASHHWRVSQRVRVDGPCRYCDVPALAEGQRGLGFRISRWLSDLHACRYLLFCSSKSCLGLIKLRLSQCKTRCISFANGTPFFFCDFRFS